MRTNLPVTGHEKFLEEGEFILSKADLQGRVTYINRTFIEMSGFTEAELMGQPHNILRHPDMPPEAFRDFWTTLKSGKSWSGLVKNRCKNGDHYWVQANASPIWQNGTMVGFMSVRTRPDRKSVEQAEELYRKMRNGETKITLCEGKVIQPGWRGKLQGLMDISVKTRMMMTMGVMLLSWLGLAVAALKGSDSAVVRNGLLSSMAVCAAVVGFLFYRTYSVISGPLEKVRKQMVEITNGNMSLLVNKENSDEIG